MIEKACKKECANCPRSLLAEKILKKIAILKEAQVKGAKDIMDDELAAEVVEIFNELDDSDTLDIQELRKEIGNALERYDKLEEVIVARRDQESEFCVGALTMRAKSGSTLYEVTICRSPMQSSASPVQPAVVNKKNVN